jgi:hypothetical protein
LQRIAQQGRVTGGIKKDSGAQQKNTTDNLFKQRDNETNKSAV